IGQVDARMVVIADLEQKRLLGEQSGACGRGTNSLRSGGAALRVHAHASSPLRAVASAAMSASVVNSVAARTRRFATSGLPGSSLDTGTPARMPFAARFSISAAAGTGRRTV